MQSFYTYVYLQRIKVPDEVLNIFAKEHSKRLLDPPYESQTKIYEGLLRLFSPKPERVGWLQKFQNRFGLGK